MTNDRYDPSDAGAPEGAPRPTPVPPELLAALRADVNEQEVMREVAEIRSGGGRTLDQFIGELEEAARAARRPGGGR